MSQIQAYVFDVIRASAPKLNLDDAFEQKNDIARAVEEELEKAMSAYGFEIVQTLIVDIEPDEHVKRAMNEINAAARLRMAANEKAEVEKILQIKRAEGEAEAKYLSGMGIALLPVSVKQLWMGDMSSVNQSRKHGSATFKYTESFSSSSSLTPTSATFKVVLFSCEFEWTPYLEFHIFSSKIGRWEMFEVLLPNTLTR